MLLHLMLFLRQLSYTLFCGWRQNIHLLVIVIMIGENIYCFVWAFTSNYYDSIIFNRWFTLCTPCVWCIIVVINIHHFCLCKKKKKITSLTFFNKRTKCHRGLLKGIERCPVSIAQLVGQCIIICKGRSSNLGHPLIHLIRWILTTRLPDKKKGTERYSFRPFW